MTYYIMIVLLRIKFNRRLLVTGGILQTSVDEAIELAFIQYSLKDIFDRKTVAVPA
jgi:hypothetical protein